MEICVHRILVQNAYFKSVNKNNYIHISDHELLSNFYIDRNKEWLGILLSRYTLLLFGVCMKYLKNEEDAKDAVQQIFLKAINELEKYEITYPKSWLYKVACNYCLMKLRGAKINKPLTEDLLLNEPLDENEDIQIREHNLNNLTNSLQELNNDQKSCITLFYLEKNSYQEITEKTGFSLLQVKSHIQNGKRNLKILIEKKQIVE